MFLLGRTFILAQKTFWNKSAMNSVMKSKQGSEDLQTMFKVWAVSCKNFPSWVKVHKCRRRSLDDTCCRKGCFQGDFLCFGNPLISGQACIHVPRLPWQSTTDWVAQPTEMYCLTFLEARRLRSGCREGWFFLRAARGNRLQASLLASGGLLAIFVLFCPLLLYPNSLPSSSHCILPVCVYVPISPF